LAAPCISFLLNGEPVHVDGVSPQTTLLDYIRSRNLTGSKEGCAEGECGACAVVLVKERGGECAYQAVNSCLMFLPMVDGQEVFTVESLGSPGDMHVVQQALAQAGGSQCGYCTPGFVMSLFAEQYRPGRTGPCDLQALSGNLCRCTGYRPIRDAAASLGPAPDDRFRRRLDQPAPAPVRIMYRHRDSSFSRPASLAECVALLQNEPNSRLVAGNTDLGVESNLKYQKFAHLISVEAVPELASFRETDEVVEIGAGVSVSELELRWKKAPRVVREWFPLFASLLIRNRATLGGNLATASPIGDAAPLLLALDAQVDIASAGGTRTVPLAGFFTGYRETVMRRDEMLVRVTIPKPYPTLARFYLARFYKAAKRRMDDISTVAACFAVSLDRSGRVAQARIAFGGVAAVPLRVRQAEDKLIGEPWAASSIRRVQNAIAGALTPMSDHRGSAEYRLALAQSLLEKFWSETQEVAA
jgi:xanthine dehydrogenase small subunit